MPSPQPSTNLPRKPEPCHYWRLNEMENLSRPGIPQATKMAMEHLLRARSARSAGKLEKSLKEYKESMVLWFEADAQQPGLWAKALRFTNMEYASLLLGR